MEWRAREHGTVPGQLGSRVQNGGINLNFVVFLEDRLFRLKMSRLTMQSAPLGLLAVLRFDGRTFPKVNECDKYIFPARFLYNCKKFEIVNMLRAAR